MATTPFTTAPVPVAGAWPGRVRDAVPVWRRYWLGRPGNLIELPAPKVGREVTLSSGESQHASLGGTASVFRRNGPVKRGFVLEWDRLAGRDWQIVHGFYRRAFGPGPWALFPPEDVNRLPEALSLTSTTAPWTITVGTLAVDGSTPPVLPAGVLRWAGAVNASLMPSPTVVPYLPAAPLSYSVWLWTASGTRSASVRLAGRAADGGATGNNVDQAVTLTTTPQRFTVSAAVVGLDGSVYVQPQITLTTGSQDVLVSAPQLEVGSAATDWTLGAGVPQVIWTDPPGRTLDARLRTAVTMTLAE